MTRKTNDKSSAFDADAERSRIFGHDFVCCICGRTVHEFGNNPYPFGIPDEDKCCDRCNQVFVMPERENIAELISKAREAAAKKEWPF